MAFSSDKDLNDVDCPICMDTMTAADIEHPMQCKSEHCTYNFCMTCIESLITSSKDDYMEASDGNLHVKIFLHCPNCRSDLSLSIRDTLLLRKADFLLMNKDMKDAQLTESQLRLKNVVHNEDVQKAIATAKQYENDFFGDGLVEKDEEDDDDESRSDDDEMGVEIDLIAGVHKSFRRPKAQKQLDEKSATSKKIDKTLLRGLERVMTKDEQEKVTDLLTSGDAENLAEAANILMIIERFNVRGIPLQKRLMKKSSIYGLIGECEEARVKGLRIGSRLPSRSLTRRRSSYNVVSMEYMQMHPLPVRMPKCAEFEAYPDKNLPLSFSDDKWDGSVRDAYCKTTITPLTGTIRRQSPSTSHRGIMNVLSEGRMDDPDCLNDRIDVEKDRIIVRSISGEAGRKGVMKGDVVTHLDGEEFKGNAADLYQAIKERSSNDNRKCSFTLVFNAEVPVAQVLKRRANVSWW